MEIRSLEHAKKALLVNGVHCIRLMDSRLIHGYTNLQGGNHFRYWQQTTTKAFFLAASVELNLESGHDIEPNGYDLGRDYLVGNATQGTTSFLGVRYETTSSYISGLLQPGTNGEAITSSHLTVDDFTDALFQESTTT